MAKQIVLLDDTVREFFDFLKTRFSNVGDLTGLETTAKDSIVNAINEIRGVADILNYNNATTHNARPRSKNLGTAFTDEQSAAIRAGTFKDIYPGDYWKFTKVPYTYYDETSDTEAQSGKTYYADATGTELETQPVTGTDISKAGYFEQMSDTYTGTMISADCNCYKNTGDIKVTANHIVVLPDRQMFYATMNKTNTTQGGYVGSLMRTVYLKRAEAIFKACFGEDHVLKHREYLVNAVTDGRASAGAWYDSYCELLDERMLYGSLINDSASPAGVNIFPNRVSVSCKQLNLFQHNSGNRLQASYGWLRNVVSSTAFSFLPIAGSCEHRQATWTGGGPIPYALIY